MNLENFINSELVENLGWTLVHSLWQIALIAIVLFFLLKILRDFSANARYLTAVFALFFAAVLPFITFIQISGGFDFAGSDTELSRPDYAQKNYQDLPRFEEFAVISKAEKQTIKNLNENFSMETLQSFVSENFADVLPFVVGIWLFGVMFFAVRLGGGVWQLHRFKTQEIFAPSAEWNERFSTICEKLKITQTVKFLESNLIQTPVVIGWLKPVILVPASTFLQISASELETVIAHELIHIRRYDALVNLTQSFIEVLFFYHPCVWWISSEIRWEREFAADAAVIEIYQDSRIVYANALANLEEIRLLTNQTLPPLITAANGGNLMQRITKILQKNTERSVANSAWSAGLAFVLISAVLLTVFSFNQTAFVNAKTKAEGRKLAIGFVSIPPVDRTANPPKDSDATARLLIEKLKSHSVPAIGFLQGGSVSDGEKLFPVRANIARLWRDAGFEIGIGNFKHVWFYNTPYDEYVAGVEKNEGVAKKILAEKNQTLRYFSYPYLNTGKNADERNRFEAWLKERGITPVKYTIDNQEWIYSYAYDMARNDNDVSAMNEIRVEFINYMSKMFDHYENYSKEMFGRDINQTMVLTPSRLVADSADDLLGMIEKRGYKFVSMNEALSDEAYQTPESFYGKSGISWFERWQMAKGKKLLDEPKVDADVEKIWEAKKPKS